MAITPYTDKALNAFKKTNLFYTRNPLLSMQDPTAHGFKLLFNFNQPNSGLLWGANTDADPPVNTALGYLLSIGDLQRAHYLRRFLDLLAGINNQTPWFFQSLTGLAGAWKRDLTKPLLPDSKLEIECLESIDMRVTAMMDLYRKACYDWKYRREVIPQNLRYFSMSVYTYEARWIGNPNDIALTDAPPNEETGYGGNLQGQPSITAADITGRLTGPNETANDPSSSHVNTVEGVSMSTTRNLFHFDFCQFDMSEAQHLGTISNAAPEDLKQKFVIHYKEVEEANLYAYYDGTIVTDNFLTEFDSAALDIGLTPPGEMPQSRPLINGGEKEKWPNSFLNGLKDQGQAKLDKLKNKYSPSNMLSNAVDQAKATAENLVTSRLNALMLGNIYGFAPLNLAETGLQRLTTTVLDAGASLVNGGKANIGAGVANMFEGNSPSQANTTGTPPQENIGTGSPSLANTDPENTNPGNIFDG